MVPLGLTPNLTRVDSVFQGLAGTLTIRKLVSVFGLPTPQRGAERVLLAFLRTEAATTIRGRERLRTGPAHARQGLRSTNQIRVFAHALDLRFLEIYASIETAKSFVFITITYIIRIKHLRTGKLRLGSHKRLQRNPRLPRDDQCVRQARLHDAVCHLGNVGLAFL